MMENIFRKSAQYYDLIYSDKDYAREVNDLEKVWVQEKPESIFEIGCGTGNYSCLLFSKGYQVTGLDVSKKMVQIAHKKCQCKFIVSDIREFQSLKKFDIAISMFNVLGYVNSNDDLLRTFKNINKALKKNGLLIFDVWNGIAVIKLQPNKREKIIRRGDLIIKRKVIPELLISDQLIINHYQFEIKRKNEVIKFNEDHSIRYFFLKELELFLKITGFKIEKVIKLKNKNYKFEKVWNIQIVARKINDSVI